jgi:large subunit ribosomal protein L30e
MTFIDDMKTDSPETRRCADDFNASLKTAVKAGHAVLGPKKTEQCVRQGRARLIIMADNCPEKYRSKIAINGNLPIRTFKGTSRALGTACGKPFPVSTLAIISPGQSDFLSLIEA